MRRHYRNHATRAPAPLPALHFNEADRRQIPAHPWPIGQQPSHEFMPNGHPMGDTVPPPPPPLANATSPPFDIYRTGPYMERFGSAMLGAEAAARAAWRAEGSVRTQYVHGVGPQVPYEYPCPPLSSGSGSAEASHSVPLASSSTSQQPRLDGFHPPGSEGVYQEYERQVPQHSFLPNDLPPALAPGRAPLPQHYSPPQATSYVQGNCFGAPLTPPHTNEASLSPPQRVSNCTSLITNGSSDSNQVSTGIRDQEPRFGQRGPSYPSGYPAPLVDDQTSSNGRPASRHADLHHSALRESSVADDRERMKDEATVADMEQRREVRQQPSPDTPSFHASELRSGRPIEESAGINASAVPQGEPGKVAGVTEDLGITRRSSLSLKDLLHDTQDARISVPTTHPVQSHSRFDSMPAPGLISSSETTTGSVPTQESGQEADSSPKKRALGITPGAAPPPPYPLYSLPPADASEDDGHPPRETAGKSARPKRKRRKR